MPSRERAQAFVDAVLAGDFVPSIRDFYAEDATAQENLNPPRVGREALIAHEQKTLDSMGVVKPHCTSLLVGGDRAPSSATHPCPPPARQRPGPFTPDKEGGAPVDELDLDGDGSGRQ